MKMAYFGDALKHPVKLALAAAAVLFMPMVAMAQQPDAPPALPMEEPAAPAPEAAPAADAAAPEAAAEGEKAGVADAFSIMNVWNEGDFVAKGTLILMIIMFGGSIYIAVTKAVDQFILSGHMKKIPAFWDANTLDEGLDVLGRNNAFRSVAEGAIAQANSAQAGLGARN